MPRSRRSKELDVTKVLEPSELDASSKTVGDIGQMAAILSHEMRTPLNAIVGSISLLERQFPEGSHDRVHVDRLKRNSRHLVAMMEDVLELLRAGSRQLTVSPAMHRLRGAVDEALADVEVHADERRVAIVDTLTGVGEGPAYWGDERRVRQIVVNLLTNAIKFTAPGGRVTISGGTCKTGEGYSPAEDRGHLSASMIQAVESRRVTSPAYSNR
jgi:signal transduction histidine kinase